MQHRHRTIKQKEKTKMFMAVLLFYCATSVWWCKNIEIEPFGFFNTLPLRSTAQKHQFLLVQTHLRSK